MSTVAQWVNRQYGLPANIMHAAFVKCSISRLLEAASSDSDDEQACWKLL